MDIIFILLGLNAVIGLFAGIIHKITRLSRKSRNIIFIAFALVCMFLIVNNLYLLTIQTVSSGEAYNKRYEYGSVISILVSITILIWMVGYYTGGRLRKFIVRLGLCFLAILIMDFILPVGTNPGIVRYLNRNPVAREAQFLLSQFTIQSWQIPINLFYASMCGFFSYGAYRQYRQGNKGLGIMLTLAVIFSYSALIINIIGHSSLAVSAFTVQFLSVTVGGIVSLALLSDIFQKKNKKYDHNREEEMLANLRTANPSQTNPRFSKRIGDREISEASLRQNGSSVRDLLGPFPGAAFVWGPNRLILDIFQNEANYLAMNTTKAKGQINLNLLEQFMADPPKDRINEQQTPIHPVPGKEKRRLRRVGNHHYLLHENKGSTIRLSEFSKEISERVVFQQHQVHYLADLDILSHVTDLMIGTKDITAILQSVSEIITERFDAFCTYVLIESDGNNDETVLQGFDRGDGSIKPILVNDLVFSNTPLVRENLVQGKSTVVTDISSPVIPPYLRELMVGAHIQNTMLLPLWRYDEIIGLVSICRGSANDPFYPDDIKFAEIIVTNITGAIENASFVENVKEKAVREERDRLARDMHDAVTQTIYSASLITEVLPYIWDRNPQEGKRDLKKLQKLIRGALGEMRTILFELRPSALETASLETLLRQLGFALSGRSRIRVQMTIQGEMTLPVNVKTTIYRIAQEVFNNIAKHSQATQVHSILNMKPDGLSLNIADNGKGFDLSEASSRGMGLRIMQERAAMTGVRIEIDSEPMQGTNVTITWSGDQKEVRDGG